MRNDTHNPNVKSYTENSRLLLSLTICFRSTSMHVDITRWCSGMSPMSPFCSPAKPDSDIICITFSSVFQTAKQCLRLLARVAERSYQDTMMSSLNEARSPSRHEFKPFRILAIEPAIDVFAKPIQSHISSPAIQRNFRLLRDVGMRRVWTRVGPQPLLDMDGRGDSRCICSPIYTHAARLHQAGSHANALR